MKAPQDPDTLREPMSPVDHAWLRMDEPSNLMIINGVLVMDEPVSFDRLKALLRRRLLSIRRFRQHIIHVKGDPFWEEDPEFDLDHHLQRMEMPRPGDDNVLREIISSLMSEPLDIKRPLWSFYLLEGYKGQGCVLMGRLHHCIGDGMALLLVLLSLTDPAAGRDDRDSPITDLFRESPRGHQAARELAEFARRHDVFTRDCYAWALHVNGQNEEARKQMDTALALGIRDAKLFRHAGEIALALGDRASAEKYLRQATEMNTVESDQAKMTLARMTQHATGQVVP